LRSLAQAAYIPTTFAEFGLGAMLPVFALSAVAMGEPAAAASLAVAVYGLGRMAGSPWGGKLAHARGGAPAAIIALLVMAGGAGIAALAPNVWLLALAIAVIGLGHGAFHVARQAQVNAIAPAWFRARSLTTLAGVWRIANFAGPIVGAGVIAVWGLPAVYVMAAASALLAILALMATPHWRDRPAATEAPDPVSLLNVIRNNARTFRTLGVAVGLTGAVRAARVVVIPLWAVHIGLSPQAASLIFGIAAAIDMVLFYPAGWVSDRFGRAWSAIPSTAAIALGALIMPFTHNAWQLTVCALLIGAGNGWGSGVLMTLGVDAAPERERAVFIGGWSMVQEFGALAGLMLVAAGAAVALPLGIFASAGLGVVTVGALWRWIPRGAPHATASARDSLG
jgi:MFS family permease